MIRGGVLCCNPPATLSISSLPPRLSRTEHVQAFVQTPHIGFSSAAPSSRGVPEVPAHLLPPLPKVAVRRQFPSMAIRFGGLEGGIQATRRLTFRKGSGKNFCHSMRFRASISTGADLHNLFMGNKKPRNGEFRGGRPNGRIFTACSRSPPMPHMGPTLAGKGSGRNGRPFGPSPPHWHREPTRVSCLPLGGFVP